jgi:hypothetical protein
MGSEAVWVLSHNVKRRTMPHQRSTGTGEGASGLVRLANSGGGEGASGVVEKYPMGYGEARSRTVQRRGATRSLCAVTMNISA